MKRFATAVLLGSLALVIPVSGNADAQTAPPGCYAVGLGPAKAGSAECVFTATGAPAPIYAVNLGLWRVWVNRPDETGRLREVTLATGEGVAMIDVTADEGEQVHAAIFYACVEGDAWVSGTSRIHFRDPSSQSCGWGWIGAGDEQAWDVANPPAG